MQRAHDLRIDTRLRAILHDANARIEKRVEQRERIARNGAIDDAVDSAKRHVRHHEIGRPYILHLKQFT
jgi:hypothetical protein